MRNGKVDAAAAKYAGLIGEADPQKALVAYREAMESLTERMTKSVVEKHVALIASGKLSQSAADELAAALANMPQYKGMVEKAVTQKLGKAEWNEINKLAQAFGERVGAVRYGIEYFNEQAVKYFGKPYDKLSDAQRAILHGAEEAASKSGVSLGTILGHGLNAAFSAWSIHSSYEEGAKQGTATGIAHAAGRTFIELLQLGYPPAQIAELVGLAAAGLDQPRRRRVQERRPGRAVQSLQGEPIGRHPARPARHPVHSRLLRGRPPRVRQEPEDGRQGPHRRPDPRRSCATYLVGRLESDRMQERLNDLESWVKANDIPLLPGGDWLDALGDNARAEGEGPGHLQSSARRPAVRLRRLGDPPARRRRSVHRRDDQAHPVADLPRHTGRPAASSCEELYAKSPTPCKLSVGDGQLGRIITARDTVISQTTPSRGGAIARPQVLVSCVRVVPASRKEMSRCDPGQAIRPLRGGRLRADLGHGGRQSARAE